MEKRTIKYFRPKAEIIRQICGLLKTHIFNFRKDIVGEAFLKRGRKFFQFDNFEQRALSRLILGFYLKPTSALPIIDKILANCNGIPGFPNLSKRTLHKCCVKPAFFTSAETKKCRCNRCDVVAKRRKNLIKVQDLKSKEYEIFYQNEARGNANHTKEYLWQLEDNANDLLWEK